MPELKVALSDLADGLGSALVEVVDPDGRSAQVVPTAVTHDSRLVRPGTLFVCLPGSRADGHDFAATALASGAVGLLVQRRLDASVVGSTPQIVVDDTRRRVGPLAAAVVGRPSADLVTVGVTGTNGKTTTTAMLASIFEANGWSTGVVGTLHGPRTTPEATDLQHRLADFVTEGRRAAVLEVSSHALALHRVDGTEFRAVVFTNLGRDHLDLHGTHEEYFRAKASLFDPRFAPVGVVNVDDVHGRLLADSASAPGRFEVERFGLGDVDDVWVGPTSLSYRWRGHRIDAAIGGTFNVANSLAALVTAVRLGVDVDTAVAGLRSLPPVPGRFESVASPADGSAPFSVVVDYAHTPDGLAEVLTAARRVVSAGAQVIVVFGCGGDRDHDKRPEMGAAAVAGADRVVVTSDNPRGEDPQAIIDDILRGVDARYGAQVTSNPDRRAAIAEALGVARPGDIVVVAGKGHEQTQDLGGTTVAFDDRAVARSLLEDLL